MAARLLDQHGLGTQRYQRLRIEGRLVLAAYVAESAAPTYFMLLEHVDGRVTSIRDFRYVSYIVAEAELEVLSR